MFTGGSSDVNNSKLVSDQKKSSTTIINNNAIFISDFHPSARFVGALSYIKFLAGDFEDIAYFEPYYLKDFVVGKKN